MVTAITHTRHPRARILVIASEKGGVGKSTCTVSLAHALALLGFNVLIIDADPRGDASTALGLPPAPGIYQHLVLGQSLASQVIPTTRPAQVLNGTETQPALHCPHLTILRGDQHTRRTTTILRDEIGSGEKPSDFIQISWQHAALIPPIDLILIDTPPNGGFWPEQNYLAADMVIIPTTMDNIDKEAAKATYAKIRAMGIDVPVFVQPNIYVANENVDQANLADLQEAFIAEQILTPIPRSAAIKQSRAQGKTIFEHSPKSKPALIIAEIASTVSEILAVQA